MKKKVLCVFSLILLALVTCTILSMKIEEEMTLEAIGWDVKASYGSVDVPSALLFTDESGLHAYEIFEGTGWESGLRAREVEIDSGGYFVADRDYVIVRGASRQPVYGELAQLYDGRETAPATYLVFYPNGIPEDNEMLFQADVLEKSDKVLLLHVEQGVLPFTENRAKNGLIQLASSGWKLYSIEALEQFLENIPMAAVVFVILFALMVYGIFTCSMARNLARNRVLMCVNGVLIMGLLGSLIFVLKQIDFPASLLPPENILNFFHYKEELTAIYSVLEVLNSETTRYFVNLRMRVFGEAAIVLMVGTAISLTGLLIEQIWNRRKAGRKKNAGKC